MTAEPQTVWKQATSLNVIGYYIIIYLDELSKTANNHIQTGWCPGRNHLFVP